MPTIKMPKTAVVGLENDARLEKSRAFRMDFDPSKFVDQIEIKGYRLAWSRAADCPCLPNNKETKQPDINCTLCKGLGVFYFRPRDYAINLDKVGKLDDVQAAIAAQPEVVIIRGLMTGLQVKTDQYDKVGRWIEGMSSVTVRPENKLAYWDKLTNIDSTVIFPEVVDMPAGGLLTLKTRYPVVSVNLIRTLTKVYEPAEFEVVKGVITFNPGKAPPAGTRVSLHYFIHPSWVIVEHPKSFRDQYIQKKQKKADLDTVIGNQAELPIQAVVRYDFLIK